MTSPSGLDRDSWLGDTNGALAGATATAELRTGEGASLQMTNFVGDAGCFDAVTTGLLSILTQTELGTNIVELVLEVAALIVEGAVALDLCEGVPLVQVGDGRTKRVVRWCGPVEEVEEPRRNGFDGCVVLVGGAGIEFGDVQGFFVVLA